MITLAFCEAAKASLQTTFPDIYIGTMSDDEAITLPAIVLDLRGDSPAGALFRGSLTASVMSQADDTTPTAHATFVKSVVSALDSLTITSSDLTLAGITSTSSDTQRQDRHWITNLVYTLGFEVVG